MAWKVFGFMNGRDKSGKIPAIFGPLPCKRWIDAGEKTPKVKAAKPAFGKGVFDKADQERKAVEYARWLARRDGKALPEGSACAIWATVTIPNQRKLENRVSAVMFHAKRENAVAYKAAYVASERIDIPNWDFVPSEPVEEMVSGKEAFDALLQDGWSILLKAA
jgi:hypothetical protein